MKHLTGHTRPFAVLGHPIGHTLSPVMHNAALAALGMDAIYLAFDVPPEKLLTVLDSMRDMGFNGVNLTVPLKETAFGGLKDLAPSARRLGAVNTVQFVGTGLRGHNTDGIGFLRAIKESFSLTVKGLSLFVLGCGGAGRAVSITAATEGAAHLVLADVDDARCDKLAAEIARIAPEPTVVKVGSLATNWPALSREADLVIQATPVGMKPTDVCPLSQTAFRPGQAAFDLVYNLPETCFMRAAASGEAKAVNGLGMLLHQGARSLSLWTGQPAPIPAMRTALEKAAGRAV